MDKTIIKMKLYTRIIKKVNEVMYNVTLFTEHLSSKQKQQHLITIKHAHLTPVMQPLM